MPLSQGKPVRSYSLVIPRRLPQERRLHDDTAEHLLLSQELIHQVAVDPLDLHAAVKLMATKVAEIASYRVSHPTLH